MKRNKPELTWVGKDDRPRLEPRALEMHASPAREATRLPWSLLKMRQAESR